MVNDNRSSSTALLRNISEAETLKNRSEAQLEAILRETSMLEVRAVRERGDQVVVVVAGAVVWQVTLW